MQRTNSAEQDQLHGAPTTHARGPQSAQSLPSMQEPNSEPGPPSEHMLLNLWRQVLVQLVLADTGIIIRGITSGSRRNRGPEAAAWGLPTPPVGGSMPLFGRRNSNRPAICRFRPWKDSLALDETRSPGAPSCDARHSYAAPCSKRECWCLKEDEVTQSKVHRSFRTARNGRLLLQYSYTS